MTVRRFCTEGTAEHSIQKVRIRVGLDTGFMAYTVLYIHETPFNSTKVMYLNL